MHSSLADRISFAIVAILVTAICFSWVPALVLHVAGR